MKNKIISEESGKIDTLLKPEEVIEANLQSIHGKSVIVMATSYSLTIKVSGKLHFQPESSKNKCSVEYGNHGGDGGYFSFRIGAVERISVYPFQVLKTIEINLCE